MASALDKVLHPSDQSRVIDAIRAAELKTSGEIKVHVEGRCPNGDPYKRAVELFERLGMTSTRERNGVLIYVAVHDRRFAILGDKGINEEVGAAFWKDAIDKMTLAFRRGAFGDGIVAAIASVGEKLSARFPRKSDDRDEIPNAISTEEK